MEGNASTRRLGTNVIVQKVLAGKTVKVRTNSGANSTNSTTEQKSTGGCLPCIYVSAINPSKFGTSDIQ